MTSLEREDGQELVASSLTIIKQISKSKFSQPANHICLTSPYCTKSLWSQLKPWLVLILFYFLHYVWSFLYLTAWNQSMARKGQTFSLYQQLAHTVEHCTRFSLWLSPATTFPTKFLALRSLDFSRLPCSPQTPPCSPQQGTRTQQTGASIPGPAPWGCPCRENHAGSSGAGSSALSVAESGTNCPKQTVHEALF